MTLAHQFSLNGVPIGDIYTARPMARTRDIGGAIEGSRAAIDNLCASGDMSFRGLATTTLVESLLRRDADGDIAEAQAEIDNIGWVAASVQRRPLPSDAVYGGRTASFRSVVTST
jgi:hypothetical protein